MYIVIVGRCACTFGIVTGAEPIKGDSFKPEKETLFYSLFE